jgi:hypothetical protein
MMKNVNKTCFYNSLKKDYSSVVRGFIFIIVGIVIGYRSSESFMVMISAITSIAIPGWVLFLCVGIGILIFAFNVDSTTEKYKAKMANSVAEILTVELFLLLFYVMMLMPLGLYLNVTHATPRMGLDWLVDIAIVFCVISVANTITTPIALAYARCIEE